MQNLRTIRLYGELGLKFGREHKLAVHDAADAIRALCTICDGFEQDFMQSKDRGIGYLVFYGKSNLGEEQLRSPASGDIRIAPAPMGCKRGGLGQILLGVGLVVASVFTFQASSLALAANVMGVSGGGAFGLMGGYAVAANLGVAVALGGVSQLLAPTQKGLGTSDGPDNSASYNFNGAVNTTAQGSPVPVLYGELIVGSATASAGIYSEQQV